MDTLSLDLPPPFLFSESCTADKLLTLTVSATKECFEFLLSNWRLQRWREEKDRSRGD